MAGAEPLIRGRQSSTLRSPCGPEVKDKMVQKNSKYLNNYLTNLESDFSGTTSISFEKVKSYWIKLPKKIKLWKVEKLRSWEKLKQQAEAILAKFKVWSLALKKISSSVLHTFRWSDIISFNSLNCSSTSPLLSTLQGKTPLTISLSQHV